MSKKEKKKRSLLKKVLVGFGVLLIVGFIGSLVNPGSNSENQIPGKEVKTVTLGVIAKSKNAIVGENMLFYRANTKYKNSDGSYIMFSLYSLKFNSTFTTNNGSSLSNVIVIGVGTDIDQTVNFVNKVAYFQGFDTYGKEITIGDIFTQTGIEYSEIIFSSSDAAKTKSTKFVLVGGLDDSTAEKPKVIFEIKNQIEFH